MTVKTKGIYISAQGVEVHQMYYYYHYLQFFENKKVVSKYLFFNPDNPIKNKYNDLIKFGITFGEGEYSRFDNKITFKIDGENESLFIGTILNDSIEFEVNSRDYYILNGLYTYLDSND